MRDCTRFLRWKRVLDLLLLLPVLGITSVIVDCRLNCDCECDWVRDWWKVEPGERAWLFEELGPGPVVADEPEASSELILELL